MDTFSVRSRSVPDRYYQVSIDGDETDCQCPAATYGNRNCAHVQIARHLMEEEQRIMSVNNLTPNEARALEDAPPARPHSNIYEAMAAAYQDCDYVQKRRNPDGGVKYSYAGERDIIDEVRPALVKHGIFVYPTEIREIKRETYTTSSKATMNLVGVHVRYVFAHASGTFITVESYGEGADVGDKASGKALTGAYKYALRETLCIETGDDPDDTPSERQERVLPDPYDAGAMDKPTTQKQTPDGWTGFWGVAKKELGYQPHDVEEIAGKPIKDIKHDELPALLETLRERKQHA